MTTVPPRKWQGEDEEALCQPKCQQLPVARVTPQHRRAPRGSTPHPQPPPSGAPGAPRLPRPSGTPYSRHPEPSWEKPGPRDPGAGAEGRCLGPLSPASRRGGVPEGSTQPACVTQWPRGAGQPARAGHTSLSCPEQNHVGWGVLQAGRAAVS